MTQKLFLLASAALLLTGCNINYSDGTRSGVVDKVSNKGIICKSWEGELNRGGVTSTGDGIIANTFVYSVIDFNVVKKLNEASLSGERVILTYEQKLLPAICGRKTSYVITNVAYSVQSKE